MNNKLYSLLNYTLGFCIIVSCYFLGKLIAPLLPLSLPSSVIGLLILCFFLSIKIIPLHWVKPCATLLTSHFPLIFIPISVEIMNFLTMIQANWLTIFIVAIGGSAFVLVIMAKLLDHILIGKEDS